MLFKETVIPSFKLSIDKYLFELKQVIDSIDRDSVQLALEMIIECYNRNGFIYIFGNGGSASTAAHFVNDFNKIGSEGLKQKFRFCCLNENISMILSVANDINYTQIFKMQLENYLTSNDLVIGISGSGNSDNVIKGIEYANSCGAETMTLVGYEGGKLKEMANHSIHIAIDHMQYVEDMHLILNHLMMLTLKHYLKGDASAF